MTPPRAPLPLRLAARLLPAEVREEVLGDLLEQWIRHVRPRRWHRRVLWVWRQPFAALRARLDFRSPGGGGSSFSWLDVKLGLRMLVKHPGLTLAGGTGIAVGVAVAIGFFTFLSAMFYPTIPLDEGHRLVGLENWDLEINNEERRSLYDFGVWREELRSVTDLTAFRTVGRNLIAGEGAIELVQVAEITPSGFRLARVPPLIGRPLVPGDAEEGAPPVVVIGHDVWRSRLAADPDVLGRELQLGNTVHTVVGVMPEGFAFPMAHDFWIPLNADPSRYGPGEGPSVFISGRLVPGATIADAQAELSVVERRLAAAHPDTHARFRAQVMPYHYPLLDVNQAGAESFLGEFVLMQALIALLLVVVCVNVAVLVYARTATRRGEIAVRTALGASRGRIVTQLFAEALVLAMGAAAVGLAIANLGVGIGGRILETETAIPFWMDLGLSAPALLYAGGLVVLAAVLTGVVPALQATGRRVRKNLRRLGSGGGGGGLGRTWTLLVVTQVAVAVAALPIAMVMGWWEVRDATTRPVFDTDRYLLGFVAQDTEPPAGVDAETYREAAPARYAELRAELARRLEDEPGVADLAFSADLPPYGSRERVVLDEGATTLLAGAGIEVRAPVVSPEALRAFEVEVLAGRPLEAADLEEGATDAVLVNRAFVRRFVADGQALGRRLRFAADPGGDGAAAGEERWYEIVGVVADLYANAFDAELVRPTVYRPAPPASAEPPTLALRLSGVEAAALADRVRAVVASLDPTLRVRVVPLTEVYRQDRLAVGLVALVLGLTLAVVLMLSAAGVYALMSFSVTQRRREIGVRTALGAPPRRLLTGVFARALRQLGLGVLVGVGAALGLDAAAGGELLRGYGAALLPGVVVLMAVVGLLAAWGPARRGLRIHPAEALRAD